MSEQEENIDNKNSVKKYIVNMMVYQYFLSVVLLFCPRRTTARPPRMKYSNYATYDYGISENQKKQESARTDQLTSISK